MRLPLLIAFNLVWLLPGCMVGPNYAPPLQCMPASYAEECSTPNDCCSEEDLAHWWTFFDDPFLNELIEESLCGNFDFMVALEKVCQARANYWIQVTGVLPEFDVDAQGVRSRTSQDLVSNSFLNIPPIQNFYQTGIDAIWQIDIFGGLRRAARAAHDLWEASAEDARAVRIMLISEVASTYTNICALQQESLLAQQIVCIDQELVALAHTRYNAGLADEQEVLTARATLDTDTAALLDFETSVKQAIYSLSILLGRLPESLCEEFAQPRPIPCAVGKIPSGLPADLLRRRPDIRSAERQIAAATEQIGVAVADLFPQFALTGTSASYSANPLQGANFGYASNTLKNWLTAPSRIWGGGLLVSWPILDFGKRIAAVDVQISLEHQALFIYEKTVLTALQEVESDLIAYFNQEEKVHSLTDAAQAERAVYELTTALYQAGLNSYTQLLQVQEVYVNAMNTLIASQQALSVNLITLYKALGGGWEVPCSCTP